MLEMNSDAVRTVDRDQHAMYKRKVEHRNNFKSVTDDEDGQSAPSLKASSNAPLPQLYKDKRKLVIKPFSVLQPKTASNFVEKEVRQHDNILLKQRNNQLGSQNIKLKTRISCLEKQNQRLQKSINQEGSSVKVNPSYNHARDRIKPNDPSIRNMIRGLRKEVEDLNKQNSNIKSAVKFTSLKQLETERDQLAQETIRLRLALQEEQARRTTLKANVHGVSTLEHKVQFFTQKNAQLTKQLRETQQKYKKIEDMSSKTQRTTDNDKKTFRSLQSALSQIKVLENEVDHLKSQLKTSTSIPPATLIQQATPKENKMDARRLSLERKPKNLPQNYGKVSKVNSLTSCQKCLKLQKQNKGLLEKVKKLEGQLQKGAGQYGQLPKGPIAEVRPEQVEELLRFLALRFKAHRLSYQQSQKYLINCQSQMKESQMIKQLSVHQLMESLLVEPFCIISNRYIQILLARLAYPGCPFPITIDQSFQIKKGAVIKSYNQLMPQYDIINQQKEQQMFIQVAELITTYYQQILAALTSKRNGEGTISESDFVEFFRQIQLEQEYIDFIITQIILESLDMNHLNFFSMFQIFYMPQMQKNAANPHVKNKFPVEHEQIVEEDEEYEESKSHLGSRNKTLEHKEKEENEEDYEWQQSKQKDGNVNEVKAEIEIQEENIQEEKTPVVDKRQQEEEEVYEQEFEDKEGMEQ